MLRQEFAVDIDLARGEVNDKSEEEPLNHFSSVSTLDSIIRTHELTITSVNNNALEVISFETDYKVVQLNL